MCGIAGILRRDQGPVDREHVARMLEPIRHRGPDDEGILLTAGVGLGHRRLSIIDMTAGGHQPMANPGGTAWITYNGEIYNYRELRRELEDLGHRFHTDSDTEVILHAYDRWGTGCLGRFNGMFAFALWDARAQTLFCARDPVGIKPFYYVDDGRRFAFASEIKALLTLPGFATAPDLAGVLDYLAFSYIRSHHTLFRGVQKLLPGEMLLVGATGVSRSTYWDVEFDESDRRPEAHIVEELAWLVDDAVRLQLRADVPVGTHLSGGLDSSLVTTLARRHHTGRLLSFNGRFAEGPEYDESAYARTLAGSAGVELIDVLIDDRDFVRHLTRLIWHMDEPTAGPGLYPQSFVCQAARRHVTVALGGQGGDETFVGYGRYRNDLCRHQVLTLLRGGGGTRGYRVRDAVGNLVREGGFRSVGSLLLRRLDPLPSPGAVTRLLRSTATAWGLAIPETDLRHIIEAEAERRLPAERSPLGRLLYHDLKHYLAALLHVEDRTSMAVSLESRVPLLDRRIVELMARVPSAVKFPSFRFKHLLRQVAAPLLPASIVARTDKKGFPTPMKLWLARHHSDPEVADLRRGTSLRRTGLLRGPPAPGNAWAALCLEIWSRVFLEGTPSERRAFSLAKAS